MHDRVDLWRRAVSNPELTARACDSIVRTRPVPERLAERLGQADLRLTMRERYTLALIAAYGTVKAASRATGIRWDELHEDAAISVAKLGARNRTHAVALFLRLERSRASPQAAAWHPAA